MTLDSYPELSRRNNRKFIIGGLMILSVVIYLIVSSTAAGAQYFYTVEELNARGESAVDLPLRISGAVLGESISYDAETLTLRFTVAHMPADNEVLNEEGGLAEALHQAIVDPNRSRLDVVYVGVKPDLLQHEAQAILSGTLNEDGVFYASELLLRCPTRYDEAVPGQTES
jgi:cytochrome c-type biogenesis protein CcmE